MLGMPVSDETLRPLTIRYFAILRDQRGVASETINSAAKTPDALFTILATQHGLTLGRDRLRVAINNVFSDWDTPLSANDTVVFIPPVAGG